MPRWIAVGTVAARERSMTSKRPVVGSAAVVLAIGLVAACGGAASSAPPHGSGDDAGPGTDSGHPPPTGTDAGPDSATGTDSDAGAETGPTPGVPLNHRPSDAQCLQPRSDGTCAVPEPEDAGFGCSTDNQCTDGNGTNGRCENSSGGPAGCFCTYDTCASDSACPTGDLCVCHGSAYVGGAGNTCLPGNCRIDSDCGAQGYCSPAHGTENCGEVSGYYCHTPSDECVNDSDCGTNGQTACTWSTSSNRWTCQAVIVCL
jgi:hypothetical protein